MRVQTNRPRPEARGQVSDAFAAEIKRHGSIVKTEVARRQLELFAWPQSPAMIVNSAELGRVCRHCGGESWRTTPPRGPHAMGVVCVSCGAHGGWVPRDKADELRWKGGQS